jgi:hypothetical protein
VLSDRVGLSWSHTSSASSRLARMPMSCCCRSRERRRSSAFATWRRASSAAPSAAAAARSVFSPWTSASCRVALSFSLRRRSSNVTCCRWRCSSSSVRDIPPMIACAACLWYAHDATRPATKRTTLGTGGKTTRTAPPGWCRSVLPLTGRRCWCKILHGVRHGVVLVGRVGGGVLLEQGRQRAAHGSHLARQAGRQAERHNVI